jgi:ribosomal protein L11 methyltransferase
VPAARAEEARARMLALFPAGFEERDEDEVVELAAYSDDAEARVSLAGLGEVEETAVEPGWEDAWKRFHRPVRIGRLWVGPSWEQPDPGAVPIVIDPGRAFGTGAHPTTRLCLELLLAIEPAGLLDLGCGSGVLAVAAAKLGFAPVVALDLDEAAVSATRANALTNAVGVDVRLADVLGDPLPDAEVAVANIAPAAVEVAGRRFAGRRLLTSGYLAAERLSLPGWRHVDRLEDGGWAADRFERVG